MTQLCKVVDKEGTSGTVHASFPVNIDRAVLVPGGNLPAEAGFTVHPFEPGLVELAKPYLGGRREVQLWDGDACRWWGVPLSYDLESPESIRYRCRDLKYHLHRRAFGPIQTEYLLDPDFEDGGGDWTAVGCTFTVDGDWKALGTQSAKLVESASGEDSYIYQRVEVTTTTDPVFFPAKVLLRIVGAGWLGPAFDERGLYLELQETPGGPLVAGVAPVWDVLNNAQPKDAFEPILLEKGITVPAGLTDAVIELRLYSPGGTVRFDHASLHTEESVGSDLDGNPAEDVLTIVANYANDPAWGKSELAMPVTVVGGPAANLVRHHQFYASGNILEAMNEYVAEGLLEWDIVWPDDGSSRGITIWTEGRGSTVDPDDLAIEFPGNVVGLRYGADGTNVTTKARTTGRGSKATQDVFEAIDTSQMDGVTLESVDSAPADVSTDALYRLSAEKVARNREPLDSSAFRLPAPLVWGVAGIGDTITVAAAWGPAVQVLTTKRIASLEWDGPSVLVGWEEA